MTANQLNGRATGALLFIGFGWLWLLVGLYARERLNQGTAAGLGLIASGLAWCAFHLMHEAKRWPKVGEDPARARSFARINAIQWIAVFAVALTLGQLHRSAYIPAAVAAIVGLHLFPLARLFRYRPHFGTGMAMVLWAAGTCVVMPEDRLQGVAALGAGIILWISAATGLVLGFAASKHAGTRTIAA